MGPNFCTQMHLMKPTIFFKNYFLIYTMSLFEKKEIEIKIKYLNRPCITKGIRKFDQKKIKKRTKHYSRELRKCKEKFLLR